MKGRGGVYLLHFTDRLGTTGYGKAQHYIGFAKDLCRRIGEHHTGHSGAALTTRFHERGIGFIVAKVWLGKGPDWERRLKSRGGAKRFCPCCRKNARVRKYRRRS